MTVENERSSPRFDLYAPERLLAFSDGVFAVAITLLVIDLRPPDIPHDVGDSALRTALLAMSEKFLIYVISFLVVGALWASHVRKFMYIVRIDGPLLWLNLLFLMAICLVPFVTAVNSGFGNLTADLLYLGTLAAASAIGAAVSIYGLSHPATAVFVLAIAISFWSVNAGRYSLFLILPASAFAGLRKRD